MSYIIGNKKYTNKKIVHRYVNALYIVYNQLKLKTKHVQNKIKNRRKVPNKIIKLKMIYLKIENSKSSLIKCGTYKNV